MNIIGYDIVALAACDHGHVLVLNNNSNEFIVVEATTVNDAGAVQLVLEVQRNGEWLDMGRDTVIGIQREVVR